MFKIEKFDLLVALYIFCLMTAEIFGIKTFPLIKLDDFQLNASVAIFVIPILFTINDIIIEVHGKERARSVIRSGLLMIGLLLLFSLLATALPPSSRFADSEEAYDMIFGKSARVAAASLIAFASAEFLDVLVFSKIRERLGRQRLWLRNNLSNISAQLLDTILFITLAFYSFDKPLAANVIFLWSLIIPYWLLKCSLSIMETPFVYLGVRWLKGANR